VYPENSLPGFINAVQAGADCLELDIGMSRDKQLMITHDMTLNLDITRLGDDWVSERLPIMSLTADQLKAYDIGRIRPGTDYAAKFDRQAPIDGLSMPTLSELMVLPEVQDNAKLGLDIEIKTSPLDVSITFSPIEIADALIALIDKFGLRERSRIRSFDWRGLGHVAARAPDIPRAYLTAKQPWLNNLETGQAGRSKWLGGLDIDDFGGSPARAIAHLGGQIWAPYYCELTDESVDLAHELGLKVIAWTVNDPADMRRLITMGVDGLTTDYPALAREVIDAHTLT
jgi:glycerophosphoryl diester phosphodiesterase